MTYVPAMDRKREWQNKPGLWDPFQVIELCVPILASEVYTNMNLSKFDASTESKSHPKEPCPGISLYLTSWEDDDEVMKEVIKYIKFPCKEVIKNVIVQSKLKCLLFMLYYLRFRGSFSHWSVTEDQLGILVSGTVSTTWATSMFRKIPELDLCALLMLGRYLNYLLCVSYAHEMYYFKEILAKLYGPFFIELEIIPGHSRNWKNPVTDESKKNFTWRTLACLLENLSWNQIQPLHGADKSMHPTGHRELYRKYNELGEIVRNALTIPKCYANNSSELFFAKYPFPETIKRGSEPDGPPFVVDSNVKFPPDKCNVTFSAIDDFHPFI